MGGVKPALVHGKFVTGLGGARGKMSGSKGEGVIYMSDSRKHWRKRLVPRECVDH